jgi:hypothetical protein
MIAEFFAVGRGGLLSCVITRSSDAHWDDGACSAPPNRDGQPDWPWLRARDTRASVIRSADQQWQGPGVSAKNSDAMTEE